METQRSFERVPRGRGDRARGGDSGDLADDVAALDTEGIAGGQEVFNTATCAKCHWVGSLGRDFCPDLSNVFRRCDGDSSRVLTEILEPSKTIEAKYMNYLFVLTSGEVATGIITAEDANSLTVQSSSDDSLAVSIDKSDTIERDTACRVYHAGRPSGHL